MRCAATLCSLMFAAVVYGQGIVTPMFVHKDGEASAGGYSGSHKDLLVDGDAEQVVAWVTFQSAGIDLSRVASATLTVYVKTLDSPGALGVYPLTAPVVAPENSLALSSLPVATSAVATAALATADIENVVQLDITATVTGGAFHGIALASDDGLRATFDAKEGDLAPVVLLTWDIESAAAKWHSGAAAPDASLGSDGDFHLNTVTGDVSAKSGGAWSVAMNIMGDTGPRGPEGPQGLQGPQGLPGSFPSGTAVGDMQYWDGTQWVMIPVGRPGQALTLTGSQVPQWSQMPGTVTDIDGNVYRTVIIGAQEWSLTNIRTTHYGNGDPIDYVTEVDAWGALSAGGYCYRGNTTDPALRQKWGALYNWYAVSDSRGLAPEGWRVATHDDWTTLENYLVANGYDYLATIGGNKIAKSLAAGTWTNNTTAGVPGNNQYANNRSGFSGLACGYRGTDGLFMSPGNYAFWWSATPTDMDYAWSRFITDNTSILTTHSSSKKCGCSVRLVRDVE